MSAHYLGSLTLGGCLPTALTAAAELDATATIALPELSGKLAGLLNVQAALTIQPPTLNASLSAALKIVAELQASISLGLPGATLQLSALAAIIAEIEASLGSIQAAIALAAALSLQLGTAGVHAYSFTGRADELGPAVRSITIGGLPGGAPSDFAGAVLFAATAPAARVALGGFCGVDLNVI